MGMKLASRITVEEGVSKTIEEGSNATDFSEADGIVAHSHCDIATDHDETDF